MRDAEGFDAFCAPTVRRGTGTVKARLARGRQALAPLLSGQPPAAGGGKGVASRAG